MLRRGKATSSHQAAKARAKDNSSVMFCYLILLIAVVGSVPTRAQDETSPLPPPRPGLVAVQWPRLSQLEIEVRDQIKSQQAVLTATVRDPKSSDKKLSDDYGSLGEVYQAYSLNAPAQQCYQNASRLAPKEFRWMYLLARVEHLLGRADEAIQHYRSAATLQPAYVPTYLNLGKLYLELDRLEPAGAAFALALQKEPNNAAAHYEVGQVALSQGNFAKAVEHFEKTLALVPEAKRIHYPLALAYRGLGNMEKARFHLSQQNSVGVRVTDPLVDQLAELARGGRVHMIRGKLALEAKRYQDAVTEFRKAIEADKESVSAYVNLGAALNQLGDERAAAEQFEKALGLDPQNLTARFNLAVLLARDNKHADSIVHLKAVLATNTNDVGARMFLAQELVKVDRVDEAIAEYSRVVESDPGNEGAVVSRAQVQLNHGKFKAALEGLEKAIAEYPQRTNTTALLSFTLSTSPQLNLRDGTRALKLAQALHSTNASLQNGMLVVLALAETGNCTEAFAWQKKLIAQATMERNEVQLERLKRDLNRYENAKSCRP